jgi:lysophospholipase L1-like esterase
MEKPPDTKRILFIGDSFTMGWGVKEEEAYPRVVESLLNGKGLPHKIETINAGFSAAGPSGYYLSLKYQGMQYEPDMVIIGFYLGNDIAARKYIDWVQTDEDGLPDVVRSKNSYIDFRGSIRFKDAPLKYQIPILRNSHLFMFLLGKIPGKNYFDVSSKMMTQTTEDLACIFNKDCHDLDEVKNDQKKIFLAMKAITKEKGIPLVVVFIPIEFQVNFNAGYKANLNLPLLPSERRYPIDEFSDFFEGNGITYIDLLPPFLTSLDQNLYFRDDDHWNAKGHAFAAEIISKKIIEFLQ